FIIKNLGRSLILLLPCALSAQSVYLSQDHKHRQLLDRLEIKLRSPLLQVSTVKPFSRQLAVTVAEGADSLAGAIGVPLSGVERYGFHQVLMNNSEWVKGDKSTFASRHPLWNTIYRNKANFFEVDEKDFFLAVNPVLQQQQSLEQH